MVVQRSIYEELAEFMASMDPAKVMDYKASEEAQSRLEFLLEKKRDNKLSPDEQAELEHYFTVERIVRLAKARALLRLPQ